MGNGASRNSRSDGDHKGDKKSTLPISKPDRIILLNNDIHLRKNSIQLCQDPYQKNFAYLTFKMDLLTFCKISIYFMVNHEEDSLRKITKSITAVDPKKKLHFKFRNTITGLNMEFPQIMQINLNQFEYKQLNKAKDNYFPLIIKVKRTGEYKEENNKKSDKESKLKSKIEKKIIFYFCELSSDQAEPDKINNNELKIKVIQEKLQIGLESFFVEEIFGIQSTEICNQSAGLKEWDSDCVICMGEKIDTIILPCKHMCLCIDCARDLQQTNKLTARKCPICRKTIESFLRLVQQKQEPQEGNK